ncbi:MAG TPA: Ig-like domain-containing protein, partial [Abditibacteriaceae bacterium]
VAANDTYSTDEDKALTVANPGVLFNDSDADGTALSAQAVTQPANGTLTLNAAGGFIYTPKKNFNGVDTFPYKANDGALTSGVATVTITVNSVNDAPVAQAWGIYGLGDLSPYDIPLRGTDADGDTLSFTILTQPPHGTLGAVRPGATINERVVTYTPEPEYVGRFSFTYKVNDGTTDSAVATIEIATSLSNRAPVAVADSYSVDEDSTLTIAAPGLLANDTDRNNDSITVSWTPQTVAANGTVTVQSNGSFVYTPKPNFSGTDTFTYKARDYNLISEPGTVTITVNPINDAPVATGASYSVPGDGNKAITLGASDLDNNPLTYSIVSQPQNGTLSRPANTAPNGPQFIYTPNANITGTDSFTFKANDGTLDSNIATVSVTITAVNRVPVAGNLSVETDEDSAKTVVLSGSDADGDALTYSIVTQPTRGTLGPLVTNNGVASVLYTPGANYSGEDSFTYRVSDGVNTSPAATVSINVRTVNDAPTADNQTTSTAQDTAKSIILTARDIDNTTLTFTIVTPPQHGTLSEMTTGPNVTQRTLTYTPEAGYSGPDSFSWKASDFSADSNIARVDITVRALPVARDDSYSVNEDTWIRVENPGVLANDTFSPTPWGPPYARVATPPANGTIDMASGGFSYRGNANFNGTDTFTYNFTDAAGTSNTATVTITVRPVDDAPVAANASASLSEDGYKLITLPGSDVDGDTLSYTVVTPPANGTATRANGSSPTGPDFIYRPNANYNGTDSFTYKVNDGKTDSNIATVSLTISAVADAPVADPVSVTTDEDTAKTVVLSGRDADGDTLTYSIVSQPTRGTLGPLVTNNGIVSVLYTPSANTSGEDSFTYRVSDGVTTSATATVSVSVQAVNDAPSAIDQSVSATPNTAKSIILTARDLDNTTLTFTIVTPPQHGTLSEMTTGPNATQRTLTYTPEAGYSGADSFTWKANDSIADSNIATVSITVRAVPVARDDSYSVDEDTWI